MDQELHVLEVWRRKVSCDVRKGVVLSLARKSTMNSTQAQNQYLVFSFLYKTQEKGGKTREQEKERRMWCKNSTWLRKKTRDQDGSWRMNQRLISRQFIIISFVRTERRGRFVTILDKTNNEGECSPWLNPKGRKMLDTSPVDRELLFLQLLLQLLHSIVFGSAD